MRRVLAPLLAIALVVLASCGSDGRGGSNDANDTGTATTTSATKATTGSGGATSTTSGGGHHHSSGVTAEGTKVLQFWVRGDKLATGANGVDEGDRALGNGAIDLLLAGPTQPDSLSGMTTLVPDGTELLGLDIADGTATVDLSGEFASSGSATAMHLRIAQVVFTLTQFPTVDRVTFHIDGVQPDGLGPHGLPATYEGRSAFADVTPSILPESPTPYENVTSPLSISGMSNTFEGVLHWSVSTTEGSLLKDGTAKATAGTGTWGTFEFDAALPDYRGNVIVSLWEEGGASGTDRTNLYEVLVNLT